MYYYNIKMQSSNSNSQVLNKYDIFTFLRENKILKKDKGKIQNTHVSFGGMYGSYHIPG